MNQQHRPREIDLQQSENKFFSQNGEDGVLLKIFEWIGTKSKFFVELGVENGTQCNTYFLREFLNWHGLMIDAHHYNPDINLQQELITAENIEELFVKYRIPEEFDLLSIDIDFNDFYVWKKILEKYRPRVAVVEYNATHLPNEDKVVIYNPTYFWDSTNYFGASILALYKLGRKYHYSLVYAENQGVNLFFIRDDILENSQVSFKNTNVIEKIYKSPKYGRGPNGGHASDPLNRQYVSTQELDLLGC
jgi:hypothetical protein